MWVGNQVEDSNRNTLSDPSGKSYSWDFENRLTQAVVPGTNGGTNHHDAIDGSSGALRHDFGERSEESASG